MPPQPILAKASGMKTCGGEAKQFHPAERVAEWHATLQECDDESVVNAMTNLSLQKRQRR